MALKFDVLVVCLFFRGFGLHVVCLYVFLGFWAVSSDSLAFSASIALFFVPNDFLGPDVGPQHVKTKLENLSKTR